MRVAGPFRPAHAAPVRAGAALERELQATYLLSASCSCFFIMLERPLTPRRLRRRRYAQARDRDRYGEGRGLWVSHGSNRWSGVRPVLRAEFGARPAGAGELRTLHAMPFASNAVSDPDGNVYFTQSGRFLPGPRRTVRLVCLDESGQIIRDPRGRIRGFRRPPESCAVGAGSMPAP
jgi:hypothetical protein